VYLEVVLRLGYTAEADGKAKVVQMRDISRVVRVEVGEEVGRTEVDVRTEGENVKLWVRGESVKSFAREDVALKYEVVEVDEVVESGSESVADGSENRRVSSVIARVAFFDFKEGKAARQESRGSEERRREPVRLDLQELATLTKA
jgi:hypothetical protein